MVQKLQFTKEEIQGIQIETANKEIIKVKHIIETTFKLKSLNNSTFNLEAVVVRDLCTDVILGSDFLSVNEAILNYAENTVTLDGRSIYVNLETRNKQTNTFEKMVNSKSKLLCTKKKEFFDDLQEYNSTDKLGTYNALQHKIQLHSSFKFPVQQFPVPFSLREIAREHIEKLLSMNIIRKSHSKTCCPAFFALKPNKSVRLIIDCSPLNKLTTKEVFPVPNLMECLTDLCGSSYFTTLALNMGYYQVKMYEDSIKFTSFVIMNEQYEFLRMPFGLTNARRTFQRIMQNILGHLNFVKLYLDDVLIYSRDLETHFTCKRRSKNY